MSELKTKIMLDVGCGPSKQHGWIGIDRRELPGVDLVHDLEVFPWPLEDDSCSVIKCSHVVEHIKPWYQIPFMDECWRVLGHDDALLISTPYGGSYRYNMDPTHCSPWVEDTVGYFAKGYPLYNIYKPKPWRIEAGPYWSVNGDLEVALRAIKDEADA
jgi:predicted SAM-dependent methyltransferase